MRRALLVALLLPVVAVAAEPPAVTQWRKDFFEDIAKRGRSDLKDCSVLWSDDLGMFSVECANKPMRCWFVPNPDGTATGFLVGCEERAPGSAKERGA